MIRVLLSASPEAWETWRAPLSDAFTAAGLDVDLATDHAPETVEYIVFAPHGVSADFTPYTQCKAVLSLWAGVEEIVENPTLTQPLTRMVDDGLRDGMVQWVAGHVLRHHLDIDRDIHGQDGIWRHRTVPLARNRRVGILGLGALGVACGVALARLDFDVAGWARSPKSGLGFPAHTGESGLSALLSRSDILVLLLPQTPETDSLLDAARLAELPQGAVIVNPGRGPLIDDAALLEALDSGRLAHATLDVFRTEPLPQDHPFWAHPKVTVTPHIASDTRPETAAPVIAANIMRSEAGKPLLHRVDRCAGY